MVIRIIQNPSLGLDIEKQHNSNPIKIYSSFPMKK